MKILQALEPVVMALKGAGVATSIDPANLNPPCAWVTPSSLEMAYLNGDGELTCDVYLVTADNGLFDSMVALETMLAKALTVLDPDGPIDVAAGVETSGNRVLPAFKIPVIVRSPK